MADTTGGFVLGMIMHWSGSIVSIPTGWLLCDGQTVGGVTPPNLKDYFVVGAGNTYTPDNTGGATTHTHPFSYSGSGSIAPGNVILAGTITGKDFNISGNSTTAAATSLPPYYALAFIFNPDMTRGIPDDAILIWSGSTATIPASFLLCDGNNGTINLKDKFIIGAGNLYAVGANSATSTHQHTLSHSSTAGLIGTGVITSAPTGGIFDSYGNYTVSGSTPPPGPSHIPPYYAYCFIQNTSGGTRGIITGMIAYWSGTEASIPTGFTLATELKDKFVIGAGGTYNVGATGGTATHNHGSTGGGGGITLAGGTKLLAGVGYVPGGGCSAAFSFTSATIYPPYYALCYIKKS